ncbi:MAG: DUF2254 domain-containing protein [Myxococcota bacterium]
MRLPLSMRDKQRGWGIPAVYVAVTMTVGMALPRLEARYLEQAQAAISAPAMMAIGSAIASGMIALTGIVFSLAFVMVQFSATAYSPRLVLWVARDKVLSHALGMFTATFLYALIVLAWVDRHGSGRVPFFSGWLVVGMLLGSMALFIALIERLSLLQVNRMLVFTADQGRKAIEDLYPAEAASAAAQDAAFEELPVTQTLVFRGHPRVIQALDVPRLVQLAQTSSTVIEMVASVGDTTLERTPLLRVRGGKAALREEALLACLALGEERTFEQDPKYALRLVVDIAIKALSPAVNDPTTAVQALDQIEDLLIRLGHRQLDVGQHRDAQGALRLVVYYPTWEDFLRLSLDEIRFCGGNSVQVMRRMKALIKNLLEVLPASRHAALRGWEARVQGTIERSFSDAQEKQDASRADRQGLGMAEDEAQPPAS